MAARTATPHTEDNVLYNTLSVCPMCTLIDHKGLELQKSQVLIKYHAVWLRVICETHGCQDTLYCSNVEWFKNMMKFSPHRIGVSDIEELKQSMAPHPTRLPLVTEITLFENGEFISDATLEKKISTLVRLFQPSKKQFILKLSGKLADNIETLNSKILFAFGQLKRSEPVLVDVSYERLVLLSRLQDSCFLHPRIYPSLKYYVKYGDEELSTQEIRQMLETLSQFAGIKTMVSISIQKPWPNINPLLEMLRKEYCGLVRLIELNLERAPSVIIESVTKKAEQKLAAATASSNKENTPTKAKMIKEKKAKEVHPLMDESDSSSEGDVEYGYSNVDSAASQLEEPVSYTSSLDPYELIQHLNAISNGDIQVEDFYPTTVAGVLEPFLHHVGVGNFCIRPSPFCGFGACFFTTETIKSCSVSKYIDFGKFSELMKSLLPSIREKGIGFWTARSIKKHLKASAKQKLPDIIGYMADSSKSAIVDEFIDKLQFLVLHNNMDVASIDMSRRCDCSVLSLEENRLVASCSGCF